jgi:hypothetical protein
VHVFCLFNALRESSLRLAFSGGRNIDPAINVKTVIWESDPSFRNRIMKYGYNDYDIQQYLKWLKIHKHISAYRWIRVKNSHPIEKTQKN